jgi:hypothetical protein
VVNIFYPESKIYHDGSHYIAIPPSTNPCKKRPKPPEELVTVVEETTKDNTAAQVPENGESATGFVEQTEAVSEATETEQKQEVRPKQKKERKATRSDLFNEYWAEAQELAKNKRHRFLVDKMRPYFNSDIAAKAFVELKTEAKIKSIIARKTRFIRKAYMNDFNYFFTFTYDDKKHTAESFRKSLLICLRNFSSRNGWKYMGVWEHGSKTKRLHFHGLFWVPDGTMPGEILERNDYDFKSHNRKITVQNTYFNERFGRCDVEPIRKGIMPYDRALGYILKYIAKTGEKIIYSRNLPMYVISDIDENDVIMRCGMEDKKLLLFDNFVCWDEGELIGEMSAETKKRLRTSN